MHTEITEVGYPAITGPDSCRCRDILRVEAAALARDILLHPTSTGLPAEYPCMYFKYPPEIRKIIYTTNAIENFNRQLRKMTKSKTIFPTDDALFKILYLAMCDITEKWTGAGWNWGQTLDQLCIYFEGRITPADID